MSVADNRPACFPDACASAEDAQSEKERLLLTAPVAVKVQRRNLFRCLISWKKHKISPLLGSAPCPAVREVKQVEHLDEQTTSLWTSLPEHLLEAMLSLIKEGKDKDDWAHVQVSDQHTSQKTQCPQVTLCIGSCSGRPSLKVSGARHEHLR